MKYMPEMQGKAENIFVLYLRSSNKCVIGKIDFTYSILLLC